MPNCIETLQSTQKIYSMNFDELSRTWMWNLRKITSIPELRSVGLTECLFFHAKLISRDHSCKIQQWGISPNSCSWGYNPGTLSWSQGSATHLKVEHTQISSTGARSSNLISVISVMYQDDIPFSVIHTLQDAQCHLRHWHASLDVSHWILFVY